MLNPDNCERTNAKTQSFRQSRRLKRGFGELARRTDIITLSDTLILELKLNNVPVDFRVEGCVAGQPGIRETSFNSF